MAHERPEEMINEGSRSLYHSFQDHKNLFSELFGENNVGLDMEFDTYIFRLRKIKEHKYKFIDNDIQRS